MGEKLNAPMDFVNMDAVKRMERVAENIMAGRDLGLIEIYSTPSQVFPLNPRELYEEFALDLHRLAIAAKQGNHAMQQYVEWQSLQPMPAFLKPLEQDHG